MNWIRMASHFDRSASDELGVVTLVGTRNPRRARRHRARLRDRTVRSVARLLKELFVDQISEHALAGYGVDVPQAACLREREPKTGHLTIFTAYSRKKLLVCGHPAASSFTRAARQ